MQQHFKTLDNPLVIQCAFGITKDCDTSLTKFAIFKRNLEKNASVLQSEHVGIKVV